VTFVALLSAMQPQNLLEHAFVVQKSQRTPTPRFNKAGKAGKAMK
jgi:hypothetical protein